MKRWIRSIAVFLMAFIMAAGFLPGNIVHADTQKMSCSLENGILTWDDVPGADYYEWDVDSTHSYSGIDSGVNVYGTLDELAALSDYRPEGGSYTIHVFAYQDEEVIASDTITETYKPRKIPAINVKIDGSRYSWDQVDGTDRYLVTIDGCGYTQTDTFVQIDEFIDTLIRQGQLENNKTEWEFSVKATDDYDVTLAYYSSTVTYESQAQPVDAVEITPQANGTVITVEAIEGAHHYELSYNNYFESYTDNPFDCESYLEWLYEADQIANGEDVDIPLTVYDEYGVAIGIGSVMVHFETGYAPVDEDPILATSTIDKDEVVYNGKAQTPKVVVTAEENGKTITLVKGVDYDLRYFSYNQDSVVDAPKDVGTYEIEVMNLGAKYDCENYFLFTITRAPQTITGPSASYKKTFGASAFNLNAKAKGKLTYKSSNTKVAAVSTAGKVSIKGAGKATITISAAGTDNYINASKKVTITVNKAANPLKLKAVNATVKYSRLKKSSQALAVSKVMKVTKKGQGTIRYALSSAKRGSKSYKKYFAVNAKTGKVTVKKGLKKGVYKVAIKVTAGGNGNYKAGAKTVTSKITVK